MKHTDSYQLLLWQQLATDINVKHIFGDRNEIPTHTYQIHTSMLIKNIMQGGGKQ